VVVRVVVLARAVVDVAAWMAAFDLDGCVTDRKVVAEPALQVTHYVLGVAERTVVHHDMDAQRHVFRGQGPDVQVVQADDLRCALDLLGHRRQVDLSRRSLQEQVHGLAHNPPGSESDQGRDPQRKNRVDVEPTGQQNHRAGEHHTGGGADIARHM